MVVRGWRYYNHAALPSIPPHEKPNLLPIKDKSIWKNLDGALLARWTTEFDCGYETNWWYCIKDTPFDISTIKAKRRYEINKGIKNFEVREIAPIDYKDEIYEIVASVWGTYPKQYRPNLEYSKFINGIDNWLFYKVYGAFCVLDGKLCAYALLNKKDNWIDFAVLKAIPVYEKLGVNAAICYKIILDHNDFLKGEGYICDGERNLVHKTSFQDYLIKNFEFRKAYCKLNIAYNPKIKWVIKLLFPWRNVLSKLNSFRMVGQINSVLRMEEICRKKKGIA